MPNILCPKYDSTLAIDDSSIGQMVRCGSCQNVFKAVAAAPAKDADDERPSQRKSKRRVEEDDEDERPSKRRSSKRDDDDDDDDDRPQRKKGRKHYHDDDDDADEAIAPKVGNGMATASLVLGIIAIAFELPSFGGTVFGAACCPFCGVLFWPGHGIAAVLALIGLILGLFAMKKPGGKGAWMAGVILSAATLLFAIAGILLNVLGFAVQASKLPPSPPPQNWNPPPQQPMRPFPQKR